MWLAAIGFVLSTLVHVAAWLGISTPAVHGVFVFQLGVFLVWLPTILVVARGKSRSNAWIVAFGSFPRWLRRYVYIVTAYASTNFFVLMATAKTSRFTRDAPQDIAGVFSTAWLLFYGLAFAFLYSASRKERSNDDRGAS